MSNRKAAHHWTFDATQIMMQCAVEAYGACGNNKKGVHKAIAEKFNKVVQNNPNIQPIDETKIRNKYDSLRKEWLKWDGLMNKTGAGWDPVKETICGSDEWWEDRVKEFGSVILKYKKRPLENLEMMQQLFRGTNVIGSSSTNPSLQQTPPIPPFNQTPPIPPSNQTPTNPPFQQTSRHASRRRRGDTYDRMLDLMGLMQERYIERQNKKSRTNSDSPNIGTSVESTGNSTNYANIVARIQRLAEGGEFDIGEAILFVMEPDKKDVFNVLSDDIAKSWLLSGLAAKRHTQEYQAFLIKQGGANK